MPYNSISVSNNKFSDAAGNQNNDYSSVSLPVDTFPPFTATITQGPTARSVYVTFSEAVSSPPNDRYFDFIGADYSWFSSSRDNQYQGTGTRWIVGFEIPQGGNGNVSIALNSSAPWSNRNVTLASLPAAFTTTVDAVRPTLSVSSSLQSIDAAGQSSTFTFTFSEPVTGFDVGDLILGYAGQFSDYWNDTQSQIWDTNNNAISFTNSDFLSNFTAVSSTVYTVNLTAPANLATTLKIKLKEMGSQHQIADAAGNQYAHASYPAPSLLNLPVDTDSRALNLVREVQGGANKSSWDYSAVGIPLDQSSESFVNTVLQSLPQLVQSNYQAKQAAIGMSNLFVHATNGWGNVPEPTVAQLVAAGITGLETAQKVSTFISVIELTASPNAYNYHAIDSLSELQAFANIVNDSAPPVITYSSTSIERFSGVNLTPTLDERTSEIYILPSSYTISSRADLDGNAINNYRSNNAGFEFWSWTNQLAGALNLNNIDGLPLGQYKLYAIDLAGNYSVSNATITIAATPSTVAVTTPGIFNDHAQVSISSTLSGTAYLASTSYTNFDTTFNPYVQNYSRNIQNIYVNQSGTTTFNLGSLLEGTYKLWFKTASGAWSSDTSNLITVDATGPTIALQSTQGIVDSDIYKAVAQNHVLSVKLNEVGSIQLYSPNNPSDSVTVQYTATDLANQAYKTISFATLAAGNNPNFPNTYLLMAYDQYGNQSTASASEGLSSHGIRIDVGAPDQPTMTVSGNTVNIGNVNDAISGETAYLIKTGESMTGLSDIQALLAASKAVQVSAYTPAQGFNPGSGSFVTTHLVEGTYRGYTVDSFGNISAAAVNNYQTQEFIKDLTAPVISYSQFEFTRGNGQYMDITSNESGAFYVVPTSVSIVNFQSVLDNDINDLLGITNNNFNAGSVQPNHVVPTTNSHFISNGSSVTSGYYYVYVVDAAGNVSTTPTNTFHVI